MQLVAELSIPISEEDRELTLTPKFLKENRSLFKPEGYVFLAIRMTYSHKNPSIETESFCEEWELKPYELDAALAKLQKQGKLYREPKILQLELFDLLGEQEDSDGDALS